MKMSIKSRMLPCAELLSAPSEESGGAEPRQQQQQQGWSLLWHFEAVAVSLDGIFKHELAAGTWAGLTISVQCKLHAIATAFPAVLLTLGCAGSLPPWVYWDPWLERRRAGGWSQPSLAHWGEDVHASVHRGSTQPFSLLWLSLMSTGAGMLR